MVIRLVRSSHSKVYVLVIHHNVAVPLPLLSNETERYNTKMPLIFEKINGNDRSRRKKLSSDGVVGENT